MTRSSVFLARWQMKARRGSLEKSRVQSTMTSFTFPDEKKKTLRVMKFQLDDSVGVTQYGRQNGGLYLGGCLNAGGWGAWACVQKCGGCLE